MAPIARNDGSANSRSFLRSQNLREGSWDFTGSEQYSEGSRDESEEQASYDDEPLEYESEASGKFMDLHQHNLDYRDLTTLQ